jgi:hypothetical protein
MSTPRPHSLSTPRTQNVRRRLKHNETFEDVIDAAPQIARPLLMASVADSDYRAVRLNNGMLVTWNGIIVDTTEHATDGSRWFITEPYRRLDGTVVYGDGWERRNDGTFVAQSGLMIDRDLVLVHRNGHSVFPDGLTVSPSGKLFQGVPESVGIIYKPDGVDHGEGIVHKARVEEEMDRVVQEAIMPIDYHGQTSRCELFGGREMWVG